jgi:hypothetical protein
MATIKVNIKAKQVIEYNQEVEMEKEDFEKVKHLDMDDVGEWHKADKEAYSVLEGYINFADIFDSEREFTDVTVTALKDVSAK